MDLLARHLPTQAHNGAWANHRLLGACAQLSQADFEAARTGFSPSIKATLNHNLTVDRYHVDAMRRDVAVPPQLDEFFCANGAPLRVSDFAALGYTEARVWPVAE